MKSLGKRYIEMNPIRTEMVQHPGEYRWSSYGANGLGEKSSLIMPNVLYKELGRTDKEGQQVCRQFFRNDLDHVETDKIRARQQMVIIALETIDSILRSARCLLAV